MGFCGQIFDRFSSFSIRCHWLWIWCDREIPFCEYGVMMGSNLLLLFRGVSFSNSSLEWERALFIFLLIISRGYSRAISILVRLCSSFWSKLSSDIMRLYLRACV